MAIKDFFKGKASAAPKASKTLYTTALIRTVAKKKRFSQSTVAEVLNGVLGEIRETVAQGNTVQLTDFGMFYSTLRPASKVRNLHTQQEMAIPEMNLPRFRPGTAFKRSVRGKKRD
jgi:nucleoid DNA-binding protein